MATRSTTAFASDARAVSRQRAAKPAAGPCRVVRARKRSIHKHLPNDPEFWLWGLDACCRTSVVYCPRSLSCYWELAHPYREAEYPKEVKEQIEQVARIGSNVLAYATSRELKEKLDRPQIIVSNPGGRSPRGRSSCPSSATAAAPMTRRRRSTTC